MIHSSRVLGLSSGGSGCISEKNEVTSYLHSVYTKHTLVSKFESGCPTSIKTALLDGGARTKMTPATSVRCHIHFGTLRRFFFLQVSPFLIVSAATAASCCHSVSSYVNNSVFSNQAASLTMMILLRRCNNVAGKSRALSAFSTRTAPAVRENIERELFSPTNKTTTVSRHHYQGQCQLCHHQQKLSFPMSMPTDIAKCKRWMSSALPQMDDDDLHHDRSSAGATTISTPFLLADIGEGIAEVELMQWYVQKGDHIQQFDRVCEVQSDKATVEITSRYDGIVLSLEHAVGDMVKVGEPLMFIAADHEDGHHHVPNIGGGATQSTSSAAVDEQLHIPTIASQFHFESDGPATSIDGASTTSTAAFTSSSENKVLTSPAIRKLAKEYNLNLATIVGTGPKGRVSKGDVLTVLKERGLASSTSSSAPAASIQSKPEARLPSAHPAERTTTASASTSTADHTSLPLQQDTVVPLRGYNRLMASTMTASLEIPHMMYSDEVNLNKFFKYKAEQKHNQDPRMRLALLPLTIKAVSKALEHYPLLNASFDSSNTQVTMWKDHNIGIAMDTPRGLIVPVLKRCQDKSIPQLTEELQRLKEAAAQGTVDAEDLKGATFTLSNIGAIGAGGKYMCPVVTPPQVAIGAIGKIERLPRFVGDTMEVEEAHICVISWGGDHRVVDGATLARFHTRWKEYMEDPVRLVMEMK
jgi:2-oxoisovalerate dehydrogenase E2 component (dihydrolipoyl transacylase)